MKMTVKMIAASALVCMLMTAGCAKKVKVTIANHSRHAVMMNLTVPEGTSSIGSVSAGGALTHTLVVLAEDLPAQCTYSGGAGCSVSFDVTEDSPGRWWFHITGDGRLTGPYTKDDTHVETEDRGEIDIEVRRTMKIK